MLQLSDFSAFTPRRPTYLDITGYNAFRRCPARYAFSRVLGLRQKISHPAPDFGTAIHTAMPFLHAGDLAGAMKAFLDSWRAFGHSDEDRHTAEIGLRILTDFYKEQVVPKRIPYKIVPPPATGLEPSKRYSDNEFAFCVDIGGILPFAGRGDAHGRSTSSDKLWGIEYKTTSESGVRFISCFDPNPQILGYQIAMRILYPNEIVEGVFVEGIRVTTKESSFVRIPILYSTFQTEALLEDLRRTAEQIVICWKTQQFPRSYCSCTPYPQYAMPGYKCDFANFCTSPNGCQAFAEAFKREFFDPFEEVKEEATEEVTEEATKNE